VEAVIWFTSSPGLGQLCFFLLPGPVLLIHGVELLAWISGWEHRSAAVRLMFFKLLILPNPNHPTQVHLSFKPTLISLT